MFEFFAGVLELVIPDNEKATVRAASRYEPDLTPTYQERRPGLSGWPRKCAGPLDRPLAAWLTRCGGDDT